MVGLQDPRAHEWRHVLTDWFVPQKASRPRAVSSGPGLDYGRGGQCPP